jgi:hypothetical protein
VGLLLPTIYQSFPDFVICLYGSTLALGSVATISTKSQNAVPIILPIKSVSVKSGLELATKLNSFVGLHSNGSPSYWRRHLS